MAAITRVLNELRRERHRVAGELKRLDAAIAAMKGLGRGAANASGRTGRRRMSTAARKKLSRLLKQRWAQGKMRPKRKAT